MMNQFAYIDPNEINDRCVVKVSGRHFVKQKKYDDLLAHLFKTMSNAILFSQQMNQETIDIFVYLDGLKSSHLDVKFAKDMVIMMQQLFPNRLNKCFIYHSPNFFRIFYENISIFIDKQTQSKIEFIRNKTKSLSN